MAPSDDPPTPVPEEIAEEQGDSPPMAVAPKVGQVERRSEESDEDRLTAARERATDGLGNWSSRPKGASDGCRTPQGAGERP